MAKKFFKYSEADYIKVQFRCSCGEILTSTLLPVKDDFDCLKDYNHVNYPIKCNCGLLHTIEVSDNLYCSECEIKTVDDNSFIFLHEIPYEYANNSDCSFLDYIQEIVDLKDLVEKMDEQTIINKDYLKEMAFVHAISIIDAYANTHFVHLLQIFTEFYNAFINNSKMYTKKSKENVFESLRFRSFQDIDKTIIPYYRFAFGIEIPKNKILSNAVEVRNCIMHHNGRDSDGYKHIIEKENIISVIEQVELLVKDIRNATDEAVFNLLWDSGRIKINTQKVSDTNAIIECI